MTMLYCNFSFVKLMASAGSLLLLLGGCSEKHESSANSTNGDTISHIEIELNPEYYNRSCKNTNRVDYVILNENEDKMFIDLDKLLMANGEYYILDSTSSRSLISFSLNGEAKHKFGNIGNGPGEYMFPWDVDVDSTGVYVLDSNTKKLIRYSQNGAFLSEYKIPFNADAFKKLSNGNFLFNLTPDGNNSAALVITDSLMQPIKLFNNYAEGYVGGYRTNNIFRSIPDGILYYRSPSDTILHLNTDGEIIGNYVLDFKDKAIPEIAKSDFITFRSSGDKKDYLRLTDSPMVVADSLWIGQLEGNDAQYAMVINPTTNNCGTRKFSGESSVFDFIEPLTVTPDGAVVSLMVEELAEMCYDYDSLPDSVRGAMEAGNRILIIKKP